MKIKSAFRFIEGTVTGFNEDNMVRLSPVFAHYIIFAIGPLLTIAMGLAGLEFRNQSVHEQIDQSLQSILNALLCFMMSLPESESAEVTLPLDKALEAFERVWT